MTSQPDSTIGIQYELRQLATATTELAERIDRTNQGIERLSLSVDQLLEVATQQNQSIQRLTEAQEVTVREQAANVAAQTAIISAQTENVSRLIALLGQR